MRRLRPVITLVTLAVLASGTSGEIPAAIAHARGGAVFAQEAVRSLPTRGLERPPAPATTTTTAPPQTLRWRLFAAGDVLMDRSEPAGRDPFAQLVPALDEADLAVVNVEMAIAEGGQPQPGKEFTFRAPPSAATTLAAAGVDAANLGNNHSLDYGTGALLETARRLRDAGVAPVGAGPDATHAYAPATFELGRPGTERVTVAVIGASAVLPPGWAAGMGHAGVASARDPALLTAIRVAAARHDVVVVTVHWGSELAPCPTAEQVRLGDAFIDAGADAVIGHHPHVLQPVLRRGGAVVAYSLGNFVWHPRSGPQGETGVLELRFEGAALDGFTFHPHVLDSRGDPVPADAAASSRIEAATSDHCPLRG